MTEIPLLSYVAMAEDIPGQGLTRGELGTVVEMLGTEAEIPFPWSSFRMNSGRPTLLLNCDQPS